MRVFDFDGTIYDGESLFDLYLFSVRYEPRVLRYIAPVLGCGIRHKIGRAELSQMERRLDAVIRRYLVDLETSRRLGRARRRLRTGKPTLAFFEPNPIPKAGPDNPAAGRRGGRVRGRGDGCRPWGSGCPVGLVLGSEVPQDQVVVCAAAG